ncbi:MAG: DUF3617 domain-containing protein [Proteobacteria bacterium]|nr:DUF3617 domain-containing protein [Pseudomonadota bacterium]
MRKTTVSLLVCTLLGLCTAASAAERMKQGLWEMNMKNDQLAKQQMPKLSPQQMEQMKKMGINMPQMHDGMMTNKVCISKAMAERDHPPLERRDSGCQAKNFQWSGSSYSAEIVCDGPNMQGVGKVKGSLSGGTLLSSGNTAYQSTYDFKGTAHGRPVDQHIEQSGKWLAADCGNVKPADEMLADLKKQREERNK